MKFLTKFFYKNLKEKVDNLEKELSRCRFKLGVYQNFPREVIAFGQGIHTAALIVWTSTYSYEITVYVLASEEKSFLLLKIGNTVVEKKELKPPPVFLELHGIKQFYIGLRVSAVEKKNRSLGLFIEVYGFDRNWTTKITPEMTLLTKLRKGILLGEYEYVLQGPKNLESNFLLENRAIYKFRR